MEWRTLTRPNIIVKNYQILCPMREGPAQLGELCGFNFVLCRENQPKIISHVDADLASGVANVVGPPKATLLLAREVADDIRRHMLRPIACRQGSLYTNETSP